MQKLPLPVEPALELKADTSAYRIHKEFLTRTADQAGMIGSFISVRINHLLSLLKSTQHQLFLLKKKLQVKKKSGTPNKTKGVAQLLVHNARGCETKMPDLGFLLLQAH